MLACAAKVRKAYPGAYDDLDDAMFTRKVLAKYLHYCDISARIASFQTFRVFARTHGLVKRSLSPLAVLRPLAITAHQDVTILTDRTRSFVFALTHPASPKSSSRG